MNQIKLFFIIFISILYISCGGEDDTAIETSIVGTWNIISLQQTDCNNTGDNIPTTEPNNDNCIVIDDEFLCQFTVTFTETTMTLRFLDEDGDAEVETYDYTLSAANDTATIIDGSDTVTIDIDGDEQTQTWRYNDGCIATLVFER